MCHILIYGVFLSRSTAVEVVVVVVFREGLGIGIVLAVGERSFRWGTLANLWYSAGSSWAGTSFAVISPRKGLEASSSWGGDGRGTQSECS
jgi:hypothetical protein